MKTYTRTSQTLSIRLLLVTLTCLILSTVNANATVKTQIDRSVIGMNESLNVQFIANQSVNSEPDFSALNNDFDIINTSQSSNTNIINGNVTRSHIWSLSLFPKRAGRLTIPAISFGNDTSNAVHITVTQGKPANGDQEPIFIEIEATPKNPYVQAQVLYTVRLFLAVDIANGNLSEPTLEASKAILNKLGDDKEYESWRDAKRYRVFERQYAIYPQQSGRLTIDPIQFNARLVQRSRSYFDPFGNSGQLVRLASEAVKLNVKPIPKAFTGQNWLPAAHIKLTETWAEEPPIFKVGEPITRSITLTAAGLTSTQIPEFQQKNIEHFKLYPDKPYTEDQTNQNGTTGLRQEKTAIIPTKGGEYILPKIEIPWWNTRNNQFEIAQIPERKVTVIDALPKPNSNESINKVPPTNNSKQNTSPNESHDHSSPIWKWLCLALLILWLLTIVCWWKSTAQRKAANHSADSSKGKNLNHIKQALQNACHNNDMHAAKTSLLDWACFTWPEAHCTNLGQVSNNVSSKLKNSIDLLNDALYSNHNKQWEGRTLWESFQDANIVSNSTKKSDKILEPLHKIV